MKFPILTLFSKGLYIDNRVNKEAEAIVTDTLMKLNKLSVYFVVEEMAEDPFVDKISTSLDSFLEKSPLHMDFIVHSLNVLFYVHLWKLRILLTKVKFLFIFLLNFPQD